MLLKRNNILPGLLRLLKLGISNLYLQIVTLAIGEEIELNKWVTPDFIRLTHIYYLVNYEFD